MRLPRLIRRYLWSRGWRNESEEYGYRFADCPPRKLVAMHLARAEQMSAQAMAIGTPDGDGLEISEDRKRDVATSIASRRQYVREAIEAADNNTCVNTAFDAARGKSTRIRGVTEDAWLPIWYRVDGQWEFGYDLSPGLYLAYLWAIMNFRVSINATPKDPQPIRWIEYTSLTDKSPRRFAEIKEIVIRQNQSVVLELGEYRIEEEPVRVAKGVDGGPLLPGP